MLLIKHSLFFNYMKIYTFCFFILFILAIITGCNTNASHPKNTVNDSLVSKSSTAYKYNIVIGNQQEKTNYYELSCDSLLTLLIKSSSLDSDLKIFDVEPIDFVRGVLKIQLGTNTNEFKQWKPIAFLELDTTNSQLRNVSYGTDSLILLSYDTAIYRIILRKCFKH